MSRRSLFYVLRRHVTASRHEHWPPTSRVWSQVCYNGIELGDVMMLRRRDMCIANVTAASWDRLTSRMTASRQRHAIARRHEWRRACTMTSSKSVLRGQSHLSVSAHLRRLLPELLSTDRVRRQGQPWDHRPSGSGRLSAHCGRDSPTHSGCHPSARLVYLDLCQSISN